MSEATQNSSTSNISVGQWCSQNRHFLVTAVVLVVVWLGWAAIMSVFDIVFHKNAVQWPERVDVHPDEFRMLSLAKSFGPDNRFELAADGELFYPRTGDLFVTTSGELLEAKDGGLFYKESDGRQAFTGKLSELTHKDSGKPVLDGQPDGERTIGTEVLESLAIGTVLDAEVIGDRKSAWYVSRTYVDRRKSSSQKYRMWQLDVTYYTGALNKVPHVPERCLRAAGMTVGKSSLVEFGVPDAPEPWGPAPIECQAVKYHDPRNNLHVQYYVFSLNGYPESSWEDVRLGMTSIFGKYTYFAKIQFNPLNEIENLDEAKQATEEFVKYMLPEVLKALPMPEDIKRLESGAP